MQDIRMCEVCCEAKRKISRCGRCAHAFYCSAACQKKAWDGHKVFCGERVEAAKDLRTATVDGTINMHLYLRGVMRVRHGRAFLLIFFSHQRL